MSDKTESIIQSFENIIKEYQARVDDVIDSETLKSAIYNEANIVDQLLKAEHKAQIKALLNEIEKLDGERGDEVLMGKTAPIFLTDDARWQALKEKYQVGE